MGNLANSFKRFHRWWTYALVGYAALVQNAGAQCSQPWKVVLHNTAGTSQYMYLQDGGFSGTSVSAGGSYTYGPVYYPPSGSTMVVAGCAYPFPGGCGHTNASASYGCGTTNHFYWDGANWTGPGIVSCNPSTNTYFAGGITNATSYDQNVSYFAANPTDVAAAGGAVAYALMLPPGVVQSISVAAWTERPITPLQMAAVVGVGVAVYGIVKAFDALYQESDSVMTPQVLTMPSCAATNNAPGSQWPWTAPDVVIDPAKLAQPAPYPIPTTNRPPNTNPITGTDIDKLGALLSKVAQETTQRGTTGYLGQATVTLGLINGQLSSQTALQQVATQQLGRVVFNQTNANWNEWSNGLTMGQLYTNEGLNELNASASPSGQSLTNAGIGLWTSNGIGGGGWSGDGTTWGSGHGGGPGWSDAGTNLVVVLPMKNNGTNITIDFNPRHWAPVVAGCALLRWAVQFAMTFAFLWEVYHQTWESLKHGMWTPGVPIGHPTIIFGASIPGVSRLKTAAVATALVVIMNAIPLIAGVAITWINSQSISVVSGPMTLFAGAKSTVPSGWASLFDIACELIQDILPIPFLCAIVVQSVAWRFAKDSYVHLAMICAKHAVG